MKFLHYDLLLNAGDQVVVSLSTQANVQPMDTPNFNNYRAGRRYTYYGGRATVSPFIIQAPSNGHWHVAIDLGGYAGNLNASVSVRKR